MTTKEPGDATADPEKKGGVPTTMLLVMVLFIVALPQIAAAIAKRIFHIEANVTSPQFQAMTGFFKLCIVLGYLLLIRRVEQIRRVFQYHGAEHKTISTYEANEPLDVEHARKKTTLHPRCGTTFLVMVVIVSILLWTVVGALVPWRVQTGSEVLDNVIFFFIKLPFLPVLASITFEIQRVFAKYCTTGPLQVLLWPGFMVQKITTIEPDDSQLEVALAALSVTLKRERGQIKGKGGDTTVDGLEQLAA